MKKYPEEVFLKNISNWSRLIYCSFIIKYATGILKNSTIAAAGSQWIGENNISLAQWALVDEINKGEWKTLDFPRIAREDFGISGIEFVNTLFEVPIATYLNRLKGMQMNMVLNGIDYG